MGHQTFFPKIIHPTPTNLRRRESTKVKINFLPKILRLIKSRRNASSVVGKGMVIVLVPTRINLKKGILESLM